MFEMKSTHHLEIHTLKPHAVSNLNRDRNNRPKTAIVGGCQRLRISPQAELWSIKNSHPFELFKDAVSSQYADATYYSTRYARDKIKEIILKKWSSHREFNLEIETEVDRSLDSFSSAFSGKSSNKERTSQNITYSHEEIVFFANLIVQENVNGKIIVNDIEKEIKKVDKSESSFGKLNPILPLLGRFTASKNSYLGTISSALQVAHAETVHETVIERDYFTAVDTLNKEKQNQGFAHGDTAFFGSGVFYNYYCLDVRLLAKNMMQAFRNYPKNDLVNLTNGIMEALIYAICFRNPVGMQSRHANNDVPEMFFVTYGNCFPYSAQSAFEKPVKRDRNGGYLTNSIEKFVNWRNIRAKRFGAFLGDEIYYGFNDDNDREFAAFVPWVVDQTEACLSEVFA